MTQEEIINDLAVKVGEILSQLALIAGKIESLASPQPAAVAAPPKAYELPEIPLEQITFTDSKTHNADGSVWSINPFTKAVVREVYGYISPTKTPEVWSLGKKVLDPAAFADWEARWKRNPFAVYRADLPLLIRQGTEVNTVLFDYLTQSSDSFVQ